MCDKSNVMQYGHDLWQRAFAEVGADYPEIERGSWEHDEFYELLRRGISYCAGISAE